MLKRPDAAWLLASRPAPRGGSAAAAASASRRSGPSPSSCFSAFVIAWGAEVAQFFMSQGLALAILAWLQTLPEFAVEADIAWRQDVPNMTANFTGSLRLLVGLGWPMIFVVASFAHRRQDGRVARRRSPSRTSTRSRSSACSPRSSTSSSSGGRAASPSGTASSSRLIYLRLPLRPEPDARPGRRGGARSSTASRARVMALRPGLRGRGHRRALPRRRPDPALRRDPPLRGQPEGPGPGGRDQRVRLHPVGGAVPLGVPREGLGLQVGLDACGRRPWPS